MKSISIIIPVYNESRYLAEEIAKLISNLKQIKYELILIENGSQDNTYQIAKRLQKKYPTITVLRLKEPSYGKAVKLGLKQAKYNYIVQFDLDLMDITFLKKALRLLGKYDIVVGSKLHPQSSDQRPLVRILISKLINRLIRLIFNFYGTDTHGIKAYKKEKIISLVNNIISNHHFFDTELLLRAQYSNYLITELPVNIKELRKTRFPHALRVKQAIIELANLIINREKLNQNTQKLYLEADDFGYNCKANQSILKLARKGELKTISILANFCTIKQLKTFNFPPEVKLALHINLVEGKPVASPAKIPSLVDKHGRFYSLPIFIFRLFMGKIKTSDISLEIDSQIQFCRSAKIHITELNSHRHTHALSPIAEIISKKARKYQISSIRSYANTAALTLRAKIIYQLLKTIARLSYLRYHSKLSLPVSWRMKNNNTKILFMSWEKRNLTINSIITTKQPYKLVIHPGLPFDQNTGYQCYLSKKNKLSVLLLNPPFKEPIIRDNYCCFTAKSNYIWPPVDLLYLSGILKDEQIDLSVIDAVAEKKSWHEVYQWSLINKPDVIILLTGTVSFQTDLKELEKIFKIIKPRIFLLGNTPAFKPAYFLQNYPFVEGIIHNFFDPQILSVILNQDYSTPSISYRQNGKIIRGQINYLPRLAEIKIPHPPQHHLFPLKRYSTPIAKRKPLATVLTAFGCPFTCKFCVASALNFYPRNLNDLKKEFDSLQENKVKEIFFQDSTFNKNNDHLEKICNLLIDNNYNFSWSANVHSFNINEANLKLMKQAGCHTLQIGVESGSQQILNEYAPSKRIPQLRKVFNLCRKAGIRTLGYFIIGFPTENSQLAMKTIKFAEELNPNFASFSVLTPDYGTALYQEAVNKNLIEKDKVIPFDSSGNAILRNKNFPKEEQERLIKLAYQRFYTQPKRLFSYLKDYKHLLVYLKNGISLFRKKIIK